MLNKVMIIGRLGRDPELRYTQSGSPVATLNVATDESYMDRDGNKVERTEWHRVSVFQRQAENCANFLTKGSLVYVEGSLQTRKWQTVTPPRSRPSASSSWIAAAMAPVPTWAAMKTTMVRLRPLPALPAAATWAAASARPRAVPRPSSATTIWVPPSPPKLPTWTKCPSRHGCRI